MSQNLHSYFNGKKKNDFLNNFTENDYNQLDKYIKFAINTDASTANVLANVGVITTNYNNAISIKEDITSVDESKFKVFLKTAKEFMKLVEHHSSALKNKRLMNETGFEKVNDIKDAGLSEKQYKQMNNLYEQLKDLMRNF